MVNDRNSWAGVQGMNFHSRVRAALGGVMVARGLRLMRGGASSCATLVSRECWVRLWLHRDGEVSCVLIDPHCCRQYELPVYLHLVLREEALRFLPAYRECGCGDVTGAFLDAIGSALEDRALDGPLSGDFGWARDYDLLVEEVFTVGEELLPVLGRGGFWELRIENGEWSWQ